MAQGIDYKLEEYNKLFKQIQVSAAPTIEEWTRIGSTVQENHWATIKRLKYILWSLHRAMCSWLWWKDKFLFGICEAEWRIKIWNCTWLKKSWWEEAEKSETLNYEKEFKKRKKEYLISVSENNSFIKAELDFTSTMFIDELILNHYISHFWSF